MYEYKLYDPFTSDEVFVEFLKHGGELEFSYEGKRYFLGLLEGGGYVVTRAYMKEGEEENEMIGDKPEDLLDYPIGGKRLRDILLDITIHVRAL